jgi:hypothetical protein
MDRKWRGWTRTSASGVQEWWVGEFNGKENVYAGTGLDTRLESIEADAGKMFVKAAVIHSPPPPRQAGTWNFLAKRRPAC